MIGRIIGILLLIALAYAVYWVYVKTWPGESIKETLRPFAVCNLERSTSSKFGIRFKKSNWFEAVPTAVESLKSEGQ